MSHETLKMKLDSALWGYELSPIRSRNDDFARELSAVRQCIENGILDEQGRNTERTKQLIRAYHDLN